jgi:hypothetical protein
MAKNMITTIRTSTIPGIGFALHTGSLEIEGGAE